MTLQTIREKIGTGKKMPFFACDWNKNILRILHIVLSTFHPSLPTLGLGKLTALMTSLALHLPLELSQ